MSVYPNSLEQVINQFLKFPAVGKKSAERLAFHILKTQKQQVKTFTDALTHLKNTITFCKQCFYLSENELCKICTNQKRDQSLLCIVESFKDVINIEKTLNYQGVYHVLMGHISPFENIGPNELTINELLSRIKTPNNTKTIKEVILATNPNVEGDTTALYIAEQLKPLTIKITRLARGLPIGSDVEYADPLTLSKSLTHREEFNN